MRDQMVKNSSSHTLTLSHVWQCQWSNEIRITVKCGPKMPTFFSQAMPKKHHAVSKPKIPFKYFLFNKIVQTQPSMHVPSTYKVHEHLPFCHIHVSQHMIKIYDQYNLTSKYKYQSSQQKLMIECQDCSITYCVDCCCPS